MVTFILRTAQERMRSMKERRTKNPLRGRPGHVATARCRGLSRDRIARRRSRVHCVGVAEANVDGREIKVGRHDCAGPYRARSSRSMRVLTSRVRRFGENRSPNLETRRELDAGHGKPRPYKFVAPGTFVAMVVSGGGGCVSWVGCVWCGGCRPLSKPASDDGPALVRVIEMVLSKRRRRS
jgi:hypothetical protein